MDHISQHDLSCKSYLNGVSRFATWIGWLIDQLELNEIRRSSSSPSVIMPDANVDDRIYRWISEQPDLNMDALTKSVFKCVFFVV